MIGSVSSDTGSGGTSVGGISLSVSWNSAGRNAL